MFNVVHQGRKVVPRASLSDDTLMGVKAVNITSRETVTKTPELTWPVPDKRMRGAARVLRRHLSPQPKSLEAVWQQRGHPAPDLSDPQREAPESHDGELSGGPPRNRKRGVRPDVRTIFSGERDPRVIEESGEGHVFGPLFSGEGCWCDVCCQYILQQGLTCAGCKYVCHAACRDRVSLDCHPVASPHTPDHVNNNTPLHCSVDLRERSSFSYC
uniref:Phorbol-ester/DAG-type domain-containing protein n=1 Tax=Knipowitschia caucasica TaxID=637954 RepID=A0AAV2IWE0_KNICA